METSKCQVPIEAKIHLKHAKFFIKVEIDYFGNIDL